MSSLYYFVPVGQNSYIKTKLNIYNNLSTQLSRPDIAILLSARQVAKSSLMEKWAPPTKDTNSIRNSLLKNFKLPQDRKNKGFVYKSHVLLELHKQVRANIEFRFWQAKAKDEV